MEIVDQIGITESLPTGFGESGMPVPIYAPFVPEKKTPNSRFFHRNRPSFTTPVNSVSTSNMGRIKAHRKPYSSPYINFNDIGETPRKRKTLRAPTECVI
jgi:hypothetical protein